MLSAGTKANIVVTYRDDVEPDVRAEMRRRGWGPGGVSLAGNATRERAYSKEGYGLIRSKVGDW
jgi:hypothetical protein